MACYVFCFKNDIKYTIMTETITTVGHSFRRFKGRNLNLKQEDRKSPKFLPITISGKKGRINEEPRNCFLSRNTRFT